MGTEAGRRRRPPIAGYLSTGYQGASEKDAQGRSQPVQALSPANGSVMEPIALGLDQNFSGASDDFPGVAPPRAFFRPAPAQTRASCRPRTSVGSDGGDHNSGLQVFQAVCSSREIAARPPATPSSTIAPIKCSRSIGIRSWRSPACRRPPGKWRACSNIPFSFSGELNCRK